VQGLRTFIVFLGVFAMGMSLWSLVRGGLVRAAIQNRKRASVVLAGLPLVVDAGGPMEPVDHEAQVPAEGTTSTMVLPALTVDTAATVADTPPAVVDAPETASTIIVPVEPSSSTRTKTAKTAAKTTTSAARQAVASARPATKSTTGRPKTATTRPQKKTTSAPACSAAVDNPTPAVGGNVVVTLTSGVPTTPFTVTAHYKSKTKSLSGVTNGAGAGSVTFDIGSATKGFKVRVDVNISGKASCSTEFTPR
jgi:hypothetical protein